MANIFEVPQPGNDLLEKADQVRLASIKISQTENQNRIQALNFMADYLEKSSKEILEANNEDFSSQAWVAEIGLDITDAINFAFQTVPGRDDISPLGILTFQANPNL